MAYLLQRYALIGISVTLMMMILGSDGAFIISPRNRAVLSGTSRVSMSCESDHEFKYVTWRYMPVGGSSDVTIATGADVFDSHSQYYSVQQAISQQSDLIILNATMERAGRYVCTDNREQKAFAELIIINSDPVCSMIPIAPTELQYNQTVQMSCSVSYTANTSYVTVDMIWSKGSPATFVDSPTPQNTTSGNLITAVSTITQTPGMSASFPIFSCNTSFKVTGNPPKSANNAPDYFKSTQLFSSPINVICPFIGIEMLCNGKACLDNEIMRFGDEISCYFEPKVMLDEMTFTLLIENYVRVEEYPSVYVLREEDVGTKLVHCNGQGKDGIYQKTRNITVICEFRDEVVWKPAKKPYDDTPYELKFRRDNATFPSGVIILCGDEPCDKPGRTIYNGTYVICRLNDGQMTNLKLMINGRLVIWKRHVTVSELAYKMQRTGTTLVECYRISHAVNSTKTVSFRVHEWPCPASVKPASANMFEYGNAANESMESTDHGNAVDETDSDGSTESAEHGDAAGAIDLDQAEKIDPGPAAGIKGVPKWNDGMAVENAGGDDKPKPSIGSGRESFILLQLFLAFIAAFVGLGQF